MHIIKQATHLPVRRFTCQCCGTEFAANAKEVIESGVSWVAECPYCGHDCYAYQSDELDEADIKQLTGA